VLRSTRTVIGSRARALRSGVAGIAISSGTSAAMPRWADLHIYLSTDFDQGSAITFTFGVQAFWMEPLPYGTPSTATRATNVYRPRVFVVDQKDMRVEERELLTFLEHVKGILDDAHNRSADTTVQVYLWDTLQYDHLTRVIGRHLNAILAHQGLAHLAWLFPPEQLLPNPSLITRRSPVTRVREVVRTVLATQIPHYYTLLGTARVYQVTGLPSSVGQFNIHPLFEDDFSDQIPSERAHDIWARNRNWMIRLRTLEETVVKRLAALETVTRRLETDLRHDLKADAPKIKIGAPDYQSRVSADGQLWYAFSKLNAALDELESHEIRAMPPHEREARFHSVRLRRLTGPSEAQAFMQLGMQSVPGRRVYDVGTRSREVKMREGEYNVALAPLDKPGFLDLSLFQITDGSPLQQPPGMAYRVLMSQVIKVSIVTFDRDLGLMVLDPNRSYPTWLDDLERHGLADLSTDVMLDSVHSDTFTKKLLPALKAIGNPPSAYASPLVQQATGQSPRGGARRTGPTPAADLLWCASAMAATTVPRQLPPVQTMLQQAGFDLNTSQWIAWSDALSHRLSLIWGPPGTGKSRTARGIIVAAALEAARQQHPIRILISASTYTAIDNVLLKVYDDLQSMQGVIPASSFEVHRLRSSARAFDPAQVPQAIDMELDIWNPSARVQALRQRLDAAIGITIVGGPPEQVHNFMATTTPNQDVQAELFDLILIDESSQMDVPHAILDLCALASGGNVILAGDPLQLPPIHAADAPIGLEDMVGSVYDFCERRHGVQAVMLDVNYRSNAEIVGFSSRAGYRNSLTSTVRRKTFRRKRRRDAGPWHMQHHAKRAEKLPSRGTSYSPAMRLNLLSPVPTAQPASWPTSLYWTPEWAALLDPDKPVVCFVYPEGTSSQWNRFEADAIAALITLLYGRMADGLANERDAATGCIIPASQTVYTSQAFWEQGVGIVTPHRAQQGLDVSRLQSLFHGTGVTPVQIRDAVDTVERFQGQERDVIIASFALGDPDVIAEEDEFLVSLNRFNVMASRPRTKMIVLISRELVDHLPHDIDVLRGSQLLKLYAESYCGQSQSMRLGHIDATGTLHTIDGTFRYR